MNGGRKACRCCARRVESERDRHDRGRPTDHSHLPGGNNCWNQLLRSECPGPESETWAAHRLKRKAQLVWKSGRIHAALCVGRCARSNAADPSQSRGMRSSERGWRFGRWPVDYHRTGFPSARLLNIQGLPAQRALHACSSGPSSLTFSTIRISTLRILAATVLSQYPTQAISRIQTSEKLDRLAMLPTIRDKSSSL